MSARKILTDTNVKMTQQLEISDKEFQAAIIKMIQKANVPGRDGKTETLNKERKDIKN